MPNKPRRRWLKFSLRTFFVLLTLLAVWLGYHVNWIRERREARLWIDEHTYKINVNGTFSPYLNLLQPPNTGAIPSYQSLIRPVQDLLSQGRRAPWSLRILGETSLPYVQLDGRKNIGERDVRRIERLFPEAQVEVVRDQQQVLPVPQLSR